MHRLAGVSSAVSGGPAAGAPPEDDVDVGGWRDRGFDLVIRGARVHASPGRAAGAVLDVAVSGARIAAVEAPGSIPAGAGREEVDATGQLLTPGLIDAHAHIYPGVLSHGRPKSFEHHPL
jgi:dihydroorotase